MPTCQTFKILFVFDAVPKDRPGSAPQWWHPTTPSWDPFILDPNTDIATSERYTGLHCSHYHRLQITWLFELSLTSRDDRPRFRCLSPIFARWIAICLSTRPST